MVQTNRRVAAGLTALLVALVGRNVAAGDSAPKASGSADKAGPPAAATVAAAATPATAPKPNAPAPPPDAADEQAEKLLSEGRTLFGQGKSEAALAKLQAAWQLRRSYPVAANLGTVELDLGKMRDAAEHFDFALRAMPFIGEEEEKRAALTGYFDKARAAVGALHLSVEPADADVSVDGAVAGKAPMSGDLFVEPGEHTVSVRRDGYTPKTSAVNVTAGESKTVSVQLVRVAEPTANGPVSAATKGPSGPQDRTPFMAIWVVAGAAAAGCGVYAIATSADLGSKVTDRTTVDSMIGLGVGMVGFGLAAGIGGVLYEKSAQTKTSAVWVVPVVTGNGGGASIIGTF